MHCFLSEQPGTHFTFFLFAELSSCFTTEVAGLYSIVASFLAEGFIAAGMTLTSCANNTPKGSVNKSASTSFFISNNLKQKSKECSEIRMKQKCKKKPLRKCNRKRAAHIFYGVCFYKDTV